jgi:hypothetical protein
MKRKIKSHALRMTLLCAALSFLAILCTTKAWSQTDSFSPVATAYQTDQTIKEGTARQHLEATNLPITPQDVQVDERIGVNTAGTVRVNNIANMEALLNILANGVELFGIAFGGAMVISGLMRRKIGKVVWGIGWIVLGLATPGCVNWTFASARDAIVFSYLFTSPASPVEAIPLAPIEKA